MEFRDKIKKIGSSRGIILPQVVMKMLDLNFNDIINVQIENDKIIITKK